MLVRIHIQKGEEALEGWHRGRRRACGALPPGRAGGVASLCLVLARTRHDCPRVERGKVQVPAPSVQVGVGGEELFPRRVVERTLLGEVRVTSHVLLQGILIVDVLRAVGQGRHSDRPKLASVREVASHVDVETIRGSRGWHDLDVRELGHALGAEVLVVLLRLRAQDFGNSSASRNGHEVAVGVDRESEHVALGDCLAGAAQHALRRGHCGRNCKN